MPNTVLPPTKRPIAWLSKITYNDLASWWSRRFIPPLKKFSYIRACNFHTAFWLLVFKAKHPRVITYSTTENRPPQGGGNFLILYLRGRDFILRVTPNLAIKVSGAWAGMSVGTEIVIRGVIRRARGPSVLLDTYPHGTMDSVDTQNPPPHPPLDLLSTLKLCYT